MKAKLKYFSDSFIDAVWADQDKFYEMMKLNQDNTDWLRDFYCGNPFIDSDYEFDFEFNLNSLDKHGADCDNAIRLYELFKAHNLGNATIYNEKFLTGFIFTFGYEYFFWEMNFDSKTKLFGPIFFGPYGQRRAIAFNIVARLYRTVEMTVDDSLEDKYELTRFMFDNTNLMALNFYTYIDGPKTYRALVRAVKTWQEETGTKVSTKMLREVLKQVSAYSYLNKTELLDWNYIVNKFYKFIDYSYMRG